MKKIFLAWGVVILSCISVFAEAKPNLPSEVMVLVKAEHDFCKAAQERGVREAFLAFLAEDSILFRPHAVNGKKWTRNEKAAPGWLTWEPAFVDVSSAEDLGYTTGPWEFRVNGPEGPPDRRGDYVTIWKKQGDGSWKAVMDAGVRYEWPTEKSNQVQSPFRPAKAERRSVKARLESERLALLELDRTFSKHVRAKGAVEGYAAYASDDIRFYRMMSTPVLGKKAVLSFVAQKAGPWIWNPTHVGLSRGGDLGYTYGTGEFVESGVDSTKKEYSVYVRIWKKPAHGKWTIVLDLTNPTPPPEGQKSE